MDPNVLKQALQALGIQVPDAPAQAAQAPQAQEAQQQVATERAAWVSQLEKQYALSDEDAQAIIDNPGESLPKHMANLHALVAEQAVNTVLARMPDFVTKLVENTARTKGAERAFFEAWPQLKDPKYQQTVTSLGQMYRGQNPQAKLEDFIKTVGVQAVTVLGLPLQPPGAPPSTQQTAQAVATPQALQTAFRPAGASAAAAGGPISAPAPEDSFWADLASEDVDWK
jgi:hypothetical protein